jgi:hypothetical protein
MTNQRIDDLRHDLVKRMDAVEWELDYLKTTIAHEVGVELDLFDRRLSTLQRKAGLKPAGKTGSLDQDKIITALRDRLYFLQLRQAEGDESYEIALQVKRIEERIEQLQRELNVST